MKRIIPTLNILFLTFILLLGFLSVFAQSTDTDNADANKSSMFTIGTNYGTNTAFYGRTTGYKRPYFSTDLTYSAKSGFWLSTSVFEVQNTAYFVDGTDVSTGWSFDISKKWDGSVSYSRYFFSSDSPMLQSVTSNLAAAHIGLDWYYLYSTLAVNTIFGGANDYFLKFSNSRYFEWGDIFSKKGKDFISIDPRISIIAGTQNFANSYITSQSNDGYRPTATSYIPVSGRPGGSPGGGGTQTAENEEASKFNMLNYELRVPVTYTYGNLSFETVWSYVKPVNLLENDYSQPQSIFTISAFYIFKIK